MIASRIVGCLLNALWQGAFVTLLIAAALPLIRRANAATRAAIWLTAIGAVLAIPIVDAVLDGTGTRPPTRTIVLPAQTLLAIFCAWALVAGVLLLRVAASYVQMRAIKRSAHPFCAPIVVGGRCVAVVTSTDVRLPFALGYTRPMVVLPNALLAQLDREALHAVILHELAHLRRGDDRSALFQRITDALFFFHPGVRWLSRRLDLDREIACDDWVVDALGRPVGYAHTLTRLVELVGLGPTGGVILALVRRPSHLRRRIETLVDPRRRNDGRTIARVALPAIALAGAVSLCALSRVDVVPRLAVAPIALRAPLAFVPFAFAAGPLPIRALAPGAVAVPAPTLPRLHRIAVPRAAPNGSGTVTIVLAAPVEPLRVTSPPIAIVPLDQAAPDDDPASIAQDVHIIKRTLSDRLVITRCEGCNLANIDWSGADLRGASFVAANLMHANLRDANLEHVSLRDADLRGADLSRADLRGANLVGADLRGAKLDGALLEDAALPGI